MARNKELQGLVSSHQSSSQDDNGDDGRGGEVFPALSDEPTERVDLANVEASVEASQKIFDLKLDHPSHPQLSTLTDYHELSFCSTDEKSRSKFTSTSNEIPFLGDNSNTERAHNFGRELNGPRSSAPTLGSHSASKSRTRPFRAGLGLQSDNGSSCLINQLPLNRIAAKTPSTDISIPIAKEAAGKRMFDAINGTPSADRPLKSLNSPALKNSGIELVKREAEERISAAEERKRKLEEKYQAALAVKAEQDKGC